MSIGSTPRIGSRFRAVLAEAMNEWPIVRERSFLIGASNDDVEAARRAGLAAHLFDGGDLARLVRSLLAQIGED